MEDMQNIPEKKTRKQIKKEKKELKKERKAERKENKERLSSQDKKGVLLVIALAVVFAMLLSFCIGLSDEEENVTEVTTTVSALTQAPTESTAPSTAVQTTTGTTVTQEAVTTQEAPSRENTTAAATVSTSEKETTKAAEENAAPDKAEILETVAKGVNSLKADTACFKAHKTQVIAINMIDCSVPFLVDTINYVLEYFAGEKTADYDFTNGKAVDPESGEELVASHEIPPTDKPFTLSLEGVADASVTKSEKGTVYSVTVVPETSTLEDPRPPFHNSACDTLDFSAFELPVGEITKADFEYPGATVSVTIDSQGKVVEYHEHLDMKGSGEGNALGISGYGEFEGYADEVWEIEWK